MAGARAASRSSQRRIGNVSNPVHDVSPLPQIHASEVAALWTPARSYEYQGRKRTAMISSAEATAPPITLPWLSREKSMRGEPIRARSGRAQLDCRDALGSDAAAAADAARRSRAARPPRR